MLKNSIPWYLNWNILRKMAVKNWKMLQSKYRNKYSSNLKSVTDSEQAALVALVFCKEHSQTIRYDLHLKVHAPHSSQGSHGTPRWDFDETHQITNDESLGSDFNWLALKTDSDPVLELPNKKRPRDEIDEEFSRNRNERRFRRSVSYFERDDENALQPNDTKKSSPEILSKFRKQILLPDGQKLEKIYSFEKIHLHSATISSQTVISKSQSTFSSNPASTRTRHRTNEGNPAKLDKFSNKLYQQKTVQAKQSRFRSPEINSGSLNQQQPPNSWVRRSNFERC